MLQFIYDNLFLINFNYHFILSKEQFFLFSAFEIFYNL